MRSIVVVSLAFAIACTKPNPEVCCVTEDQCTVLGADELRPCGVGQACGADFSCVAAECVTSADCPSPDAPVCSLGLCVENCRVDDDCADVEGLPFCADDGVCVGCLDASTCPTEAAICDATSRACRGCELDAECPSGVCLEADGVCADESAVLFVSNAGTDAGTCTSTAPCEKIAFAIPLVTSTRNVIHVVGALSRDTATITLDRAVTIDGTGTRFTNPATGPMFAKTFGPAATIEGIDIVNPNSVVAITVAASTALRLHATTLSKANVTSSGSLEISGSTIREFTSITCSNATLTADNRRFEGLQSRIFSTACQTTIRGNRFIDVFDVLDVDGGFLTVTNNLFTVPDQLTDSIQLNNLAVGSVFAFNTIVNTSGVTSSGGAITCDSTVDLTSNIIAYNSTLPLNTGCTAVSSVFDLPGAASAGSNPSVDAATLFVNLPLGDFHLSATSAARGLGEAGIVTIDLEGNPRPAAMPDVGAFEAP